MPTVPVGVDDFDRGSIALSRASTLLDVLQFGELIDDPKANLAGITDLIAMAGEQVRQATLLHRAVYDAPEAAK